MASTDDRLDNIASLLERFIASQASPAAGAGGGRGNSVNLTAIKESTKRLQELAAAAASSKKSEEERTDAAKLFSKSLKNTADSVAQSNKTAAERMAEYSKTVDQVAKGNKEWAAKQKEDFARLVKQTDLNKANAERAEQFGKGLEGVRNAFAPLAGAIGKVVDSYQSFSEGGQIKMATGILQTEVKLAGDSMQSLGSGLSTAGAAGAGAGGKLGKLSAAASIAGPAISLFGKATNTIADQVLPKLASELDMYNKSFQSMSASGATFADGLTGMSNASSAAGLTLQQMSSVMKNNSESLAGSGLTITGAVAKLGEVFDPKKGGKELKNSLSNLGYGFEEQSGLVADTMARMRLAGRDLSKVLPSELQQQTENYAKNLRIISGITGQDAKKLEAKAKAELQQVGVQAEIRKRTAAGDAGAADRFKSVQTLAGDAGKLVNDATRQLLGPGQLMGDTAKQFQLMGPAGERFQKEVLDIKNDTTLAPQEATKKMNDALARLNEGASKNIEQQKLLGIAQENNVNILNGAPQAVGESMERLSRFVVGGADKVGDATEGQANTQDKLTSGMVGVAQAGQDAAMLIQKTILDSGVMTGFATAVRTGTAALTGMITKFGGGKGGDSAGGGTSMTEMLLGGLTAASAVAQIAPAIGGLFKKGISAGIEPPGGMLSGGAKGSVGKASGWLGRMAGFGMSAGGALLSGLGGSAGAAAGAAGAAGAGVAGAAGTAAGAVGAGAAGIAGSAGAATSALNAGASSASGAAGTASKAGIKALGTAGKTAGKFLLKKIPIIGLGIGLWDAAERLGKGDYAGAALAAGGAVASTLPGPGTAFATAADAALAATDASGLTGQEAPVPATPSDQGSGSPTSNLNTQTQQFADAAASQQEEALKQAGLNAKTETDKLTVAQNDEDKASMQDMTTLLMVISRTMEDQLDLMRNISNNTRNTVSAVS